MIQLQNPDGSYSVYEKFGEEPIKTLPTNRAAISFCRERVAPKKTRPKTTATQRLESAKDKENS